MGSDKALSFQLPRMSGVKTRYVRITLTAMDDYMVEFLGERGKPLKLKTDIFCDTLRGCFERETGLRTSMTTVYA